MAPAQPSCSYADGVITVVDFSHNQAVTLEVIDVATGGITETYEVLFKNNSNTFDVPDPTVPTLYRFRKSTGQHDVIAECNS